MGGNDVVSRGSGGREGEKLPPLSPAELWRGQIFVRESKSERDRSGMRESVVKGESWVP